MKFFKKTISVLLVAVLAVCLSVTAFAAMDANSQRIIDELNKGLTLSSGKVVTLPAGSINAAEKYLSTYEGMTSEKADAIIGSLVAAEAIAKSSGVTDLSQLSASQKSTILSLASEAAAQVGCHVSYAGGVITVTDPNGVTLYQVSSGGSGSGDGVIKTTGASADLIAPALVVVSIMALVAVGVVLIRRNKLAKGA
jgi:hypothetical protein